MKLGLGNVGMYLLIAALVVYTLVCLFKIRKTSGAYFAIPFMASALLIGTFESILAYPANFAGAVLVLVAAKMVRPVLLEEKGSTLWRALRRAQALATGQSPIQNPEIIPFPVAARQGIEITTPVWGVAGSPHVTRFVHNFATPIPGGRRPNPSVA